MTSDGRRASRKAAVAAVVVIGIAVAVAAAIVLRDEVRWRWRMRGVVQVRVVDDRTNGTARLSIYSPEGISRAKELTRRLIGPLVEAHGEGPSSAGNAMSSHVIFLPTLDPEAGHYQARFSLGYFEDGVLDCSLGEFNCPSARWHEYLREVILPAVPELARQMRDPAADAKERLEAVRTLAWVTPETEGVFDYLFREMDLTGLQFLGPRAAAAVPALIQRLEKDENDTESERTLGRIGPAAAAAVPVLTRCLSTNSRRWAANALGSIGAAALPALRALEETEKKYVDDPRVTLAAREAIAKIKEDHHAEAHAHP